MLNVGDVAMQIIATRRLLDLFPDAKVSTVTEDARRLRYFFPSVEPVSALSRRAFFSDKPFGNRLNQILPNRFSVNINKLSPLLRRRYPNFIDRISRRSPGDRNEIVEKDFWTTLKNSDLVVVSGAGGLNDSFAKHASTIFETLELAIRRNIPTALFGQGIGPLTDPQLFEKARRVLPKVDLICLREKRRGGTLLQKIGVAPEKIEITGDDAIELAFGEKKNALGDFIGINLRVAGYSSISMSEVALFGKLLQTAAARLRTKLLPIPISFQSGERSDLSVLNSMIKPNGNFYDTESEKTPASVIRQVGRCRLVVTGSYHGAVFALAQGIPAVCIAGSEYYSDKFHGLAEQFKLGCRVVNWQQEAAANEINEAVEAFWKNAENIRETLLNEAHEQIRASRFAYRRVQNFFVEKLPV